MSKSYHRPSTSLRAVLAAAAMAATVSTAAFIDHLAVGYASAGHLVAKTQGLIVAKR